MLASAFAVTIEVAKCEAPVVERFHVIGPQRQCPLERRERLVVPMELDQCHTEIVVSLCVIGLERDRRPVALRRFLMACERIERAAEISVRDGISRIEHQCIAVARKRVFAAAGGDQCVAEVAVHRRGVRNQRVRAANQPDRFVVASLLRAGNAQEVQCIGVVGFAREHPAIERLGLSKRPGAVPFQRRLQRRCARLAW